MSDDAPPPDPEAGGGNDALRSAAHELVKAARTFLDAAERTLDDDEAMARWANRGQELVQGFLAGFASSASDRDRPDDDGGIEHIPVE